ncbi:MAG: hypothetical protein QXI07_08965 [Pyrobaculum sp.]
MGVIRIASLQWLVDGYYVEWADGQFLAGKKLMVYVKYVRGTIRPLTNYLEAGDGYLLYSTSPWLEYVEFTPDGSRHRRVRGRPVPLYALRSIPP